MARARKEKREEESEKAQKKRRIRIEKTRRYRIKAEQRCLNIRLPSSNLFMKLPGELRNEIYELVLPQGCDLAVHDRRDIMTFQGTQTPLHSRFRSPPDNPTEPSILLVSRAIRQEAGSLFYGKNNFRVILMASEFDTAYTWLDYIMSNTCTSHLLLNCRLHVTSITWDSIPGWLRLAQAIYKADLRTLDPMELGQLWMKKITLPYKNENIREVSSARRIRQALREVVRLAVSAKTKSDTLLELERSFRGWAAMTVEKTPKAKIRDRMSQELRKSLMSEKTRKSFVDKINLVDTVLEDHARSRR